MWTLSSAPIWEIGAEKRLVECYYYYYMYYCCCCCSCCRWWYLLLGLLVLRPSISSLLQSATSVITKCDTVFYYKVCKVRGSVTRKCNKRWQSAIGITKCDRIDVESCVTCKIFGTFFLALHHQAAFYDFFVAENVLWKYKLTLLFRAKISLGNRMICSDIWHKYVEWYFEIVIRNFTSR